MAPRQALCGATLLLLTLGCAGLQFADEPINQDLPRAFTNRTLWPDTSIFRYRLTELAGTVIYAVEQPGGAVEYRRQSRLLAPGFAPEVEVIRDGTIYSSKIDKGAAAKGSYLALAVDFSDDRMAELTIVDSGLVFIPWDKVPLQALQEEAAKPRPTGTRRLWVQAVLLSEVTKSYFREIKANASGVVGSTFGASGKVYNQNSATSREPVMGLLVVDLDALAADDKLKAGPAVGLTEALKREQVESALERTRMPGIVKVPLK